jgi:hypothetical protein
MDGVSAILALYRKKVGKNEIMVIDCYARLITPVAFHLLQYAIA